MSTLNQDNQKHYKVILTGGKINESIHYCEDEDIAYSLEFEQYLKNAELTEEPLTEPLERDTSGVTCLE
jgi:hypothetical protein